MAGLTLAYHGVPDMVREVLRPVAGEKLRCVYLGFGIGVFVVDYLLLTVWRLSPR